MLFDVYHCLIFKYCKYSAKKLMLLQENGSIFDDIQYFQYRKKLLANKEEHKEMFVGIVR